MTSNSTQSHLKVMSIEEGVLILKDGSLAVVLRVYPINFDLKNELEQNAVVARYQGFLNSLDFPLQIIIRSKRLDLAPYLVELENRTKALTSELLQVQASDYIGFMKSLVEVANIMSKEYYAVLLYRRAGAKDSAEGLLSAFNRQPTTLKITRSEFDRIRGELGGRANTIASGLVSLGLRVNALNTQQLIELFYGLYNPDLSSTERLVDIDSIQADVVTKAAETPVETAPKPSREQLDIQPNRDVSQIVGAAPAPETAPETPPETPSETPPQS